jgi:iron complex outermembrane receptor protein
VDGYYERKQNFVGPLRVESPLAYLQRQTVAEDVGTRLGEIFATTGDATVQSLLNDLQNSGLPPSQVAQLLGGVVGSGLDDTPAAIVQPDEQVLPGGGTANQVGALLTYRNFGEVEYWGVDASIEVDITDTFTTFGNVSYVSDDFFDNEELDETDTSLSLALNAPAFKTKGGFDYGLPPGFSVGATVHYVDGFPVRSGPYVGDVQSYTLLDVRAAYNVPAVPGLSLTVTGKNVLDNRHREFVGAPPLGRMLMGRLTYELP